MVQMRAIVIGRLFSYLFPVIVLGGCSVQYGPKGVGGGYTDKKINNTTFYIRYDGSPLSGSLTVSESLVNLWDTRAAELCGGDDFFKETKTVRLDRFGKKSPLGTPAVYGMVYCNTKILDTRKQNPDDRFSKYAKLSYEVFQYKEINSFWELLVEKKFSELQKEMDRVLADVPDEEMAEVLNTFSRINPVAEERLTEWIRENPESYVALYSRSVYYHHFSSFKRGEVSWEEVTPEQRAELKKYRDLAINDLNRSMALNPEFCPSYALKLRVLTGIMDAEGPQFDDIYRQAEARCPQSIAVRKAYLESLLPGWGGSKSKMREFIDRAIGDNKSFGVLEALYLAEEGDQHLFKEQYEKALNKYSEALERGKFPEIYESRAVALESLGRYVEAVQDLNTSIALSSYNDSAYNKLTRVLLRQNDLVGALVASSYLTTMNNQSSENYATKGNIFYLMRRYEDALISYKKANILSPDNAMYLHKIRKAQYQIDVRKNDRGLNGDEKVI